MPINFPPVRLSDVFGGLAVVGVVVLISLALTEDDQPDRVTGVAVAQFDSATFAATDPANGDDSAVEESQQDAEATDGSTPATNDAAATDTASTDEASDEEPPNTRTEPTAGSSSTITSSTAPASTTTTTSSTAPESTTTTLVEVEFRPLIEVQVLNGGAGPGQAGAATATLEDASFAPRSERDAPVFVEATTVLHAPGKQIEARTVNEFIGAAPENVFEVAVDDPNWAEYGGDLDVMVILGPDR